MTDPKETGYNRGPQPDVDSKPNVALIAGVIVIIACALLFVRNDQAVSIDFLFYEKTTTVRWAVLMAIVLGVLLDRAFTIWWRRRRRKNDDD